MGWNKGYEIMEQQVIGLYDLGVLNKEILNAVMKPFVNTDLDSGGSYDLKTKDGKSVEEAICFIVEPERYKNSIENFVPDLEDPDYNEELNDLWNEISMREWNLW